MRLIELAVVLALAGFLALAASALLFYGSEASREARLRLGAEIAYDELRARLGRDMREALQISSLVASELRLVVAGGCVVYRLQSGQLFRQAWVGGCAVVSGVPVRLLEDTSLPLARFCSDPALRRMGLFDVCPSNWNSVGGGLTLRQNNQDQVFAPPVVSLR
ncbi:hypothetical protein [Meiothermus ruber]|jgi:hypothetical protein|uniref:Uncharacterized protein n=1 Tax=Meiothermus ruber (strain ATCC 35948 / DSM 1279 / VKM B-1258 / 21) TaxID=504728 RepID=D3PQS0_MEIRD|nr:hypothetical protein [Meiothermus ruber]ADD27803.1 hypothetical protein Mrub_1039 [Meiothermus ruber DSM 1279]AGK04270.1 hypothetical protein K649_04840 [Meiothermus ruber DSM 1279]MCL6529973.1 hypothetical protein [Meiothermus ruber]GAO74733.1 putative uncharacterized protein [Meiothermus ruber H328]